MPEKSLVNCNAEIIIIGVLAGLTILLAIITMVVIIMLCRLRKQLKTRAAYLHQSVVRNYDLSDYQPPPPSLVSYNELSSESIQIRKESLPSSELVTQHRHTTAIADLKSKCDPNDAPPKPKRTFETTDKELEALSKEARTPFHHNSWPLVSEAALLLQSLKLDQSKFYPTAENGKSSGLDSKRDSSMQTIPEKPGRKQLRSLPDYENVLIDRLNGKTEVTVVDKNVKNDDKNDITIPQNFAFQSHSSQIESVEALRRASAKSNIPRAVSGKKRKSDEKLDINMEFIQGIPKKRSGSDQSPRPRTLPSGGHRGFKRRGTHERTKSDVVRQPRTQHLDNLCKRIQVDKILGQDSTTQHVTLSNDFQSPSISDGTDIRETESKEIKHSNTNESKQDIRKQHTASEGNVSTKINSVTDTNGSCPVVKTPPPTKPSRLRQPVQYHNVVFRRKTTESSDVSTPQVEIDGDKGLSDSVFVDEVASPICGTMERREVARVVHLDLKSEPMTEL